MTPRIGEILVRSGRIEGPALESALAAQRDGAPGRVGEILLREGRVKQEDILRALAEQWGAPYRDRIEEDELDRDQVIGLRIEFLKKRSLVPLSDGNGGLALAMSDPTDCHAFDSTARALGRHCSRAVAPPGVIEEALTRCHYQQGDASSVILGELGENDELAQAFAGGETEDLSDVANLPPIVKLVNSILFQAVAARASDIHVEPYDRQLKVRFRIDGVLHERFLPPRQYAAALVSRLKIMANLNIAERRLPQDGRSRIRIGDKEIDLRVSTIPSSGGERVVLRLLDKTTALYGVNELGFAPYIERRLRRLVELPHGIILLTGPTGSGKTTTLYAALSTLNSEERNILTVEDPIEYQLPGVGQMQVQPKINLNFANSLRHMLRQDPDVIMVGEIRDTETAEMSIQAALTGHLVFSTLHTNDSSSAMTRLLDMKIEPYLVSSSVNAVIAQRLVRLICKSCKESYPASADTIAGLGAAGLPPEVDLYRGRGCEECLGTGYRGRSVIAELLLVDDAVRDLVMERAGANRIRQAAVQGGMKTLREDGARKALGGETTVEEVLRVTQEDIVRYEE